MTDPDAASVASMDLAELARSGAPRKPAWTYRGEDLNVNLVVLAPGERVAEHRNTEVDVLILGITVDGTIEVDGQRHRVAQGQIVVVPKGARRAIQAGGVRFAYLTCHRRRAGLWPTTAVHHESS